ncbi:MAG: hypothetical protein AB8G05_14565 [Oligoflexales bacterium]
MSKLVISGLFLSIVACGTKEKIEQKKLSSDYGNGSTESMDATSITLETSEISEDSFQEKEQEGENIFTAEIMSQVIGQGLEENGQADQISNQVVEINENNPGEDEENLNVAQGKENNNSEETGNNLGDQAYEQGEEIAEETAEEAFDEEKYLETMALAQSEMGTKIDALIPNAPSFLKNKLQSNAEQLLYCGDNCEDKAQDLMITSYSVSRFLDSRGYNLAATDINAAIAAGTKLLSDVALIILEASSPEPDPMAIVMLVDLFIQDLQELILSFFQ